MNIFENISFYAVRKNNLNMIKTLVMFNQNLIFCDNKEGKTLLHVAAENDHKDIVEFLLVKGANVNEGIKVRETAGSYEDTGITPLRLAVNKGFSDVAKLLRQHDGVDTLSIAILEAAENGEVERVKALLEDNPDLVFTKDEKYGITPLHKAAIKGHKLVAELLLANGVNINARSSWGRTPLHAAVSHGHKTMVELLLTQGADVNAKSNDDSTPLLYAWGYRDVAELLLARGADVNAKDKSGWTTLYIAAESRKKDVVELLLANRADVNAKDNDGKTPLLVAKAKGFKDIVELLQQHGGHE